MGDRPYLDQIYAEDCLEGMREHLPDGSVDVIVTSPPYNIGVRYGTYNDELPFPEYLDWMEDLAEECSRVLAQEGSFFFNIGDRPSDELRSLEVARRLQRHLHLQNTIHWVKSIAAPEKGVNIGHYKPVNSPRFLNNAHEYIFHFSHAGRVDLDKLAIGVPYQDKSNIGRWKQAARDCRDRGNMWFIPYRTVRSEKEHPAAFPPRLAEMCIRLHGLKEEEPLVVLDPFLGSGSTAVAARQCHCHYVGFEVDPDYVELVRQKLAQRRLEWDSGPKTP